MGTTSSEVSNQGTLGIMVAVTEPLSVTSMYTVLVIPIHAFGCCWVYGISETGFFEMELAIIATRFHENSEPRRKSENAFRIHVI